MLDPEDTRSEWQRQLHAAIVARSIPHAEHARREFRAVKREQLKLVLTEQRNRRQAVESMRAAYKKLRGAFQRVGCTTETVWQSHGPWQEWDEVLGATHDDAAWDRLVERGLAPWGGDHG